MASPSGRDIGYGAKALLLAGGLGTRLRPITDRIPKCLVPVHDRPLLDYWFEALGHIGIREILINTHHLPELVRAFLAEKNRSGQFQAGEAFEAKLLGSAGTIHANRGFADEADHVLIVYADNLSQINLGNLVAYHREHSDPMTMALFRAPVPQACGIVQLDEDDRVVSFEEKPSSPKTDLANAGVFVVTQRAYREIADMDAFDLGFDVLPTFVGRMRGWVIDGFHLDVGTHEALARAKSEFPAGPRLLPEPLV